MFLKLFLLAVVLMIASEIVSAFLEISRQRASARDALAIAKRKLL